MSGLFPFGRPRQPGPVLDVARVIVDVLPKAEILDPQGQAVARAMGRLGVSGVADVRQGKHFVLEVDDAVPDAELERIAGTLLANPVMEEWVVRRGSDAEATAADVPGTH